MSHTYILIFPPDMLTPSGKVFFPFFLSCISYKIPATFAGVLCHMVHIFSGKCGCPLIWQVRWANTHVYIRVTSLFIDLHQSSQTANASCLFKELFSMDTCQVCPLPHFHLLMKEGFVLEHEQLSSSLKNRRRKEKKIYSTHVGFLFLSQKPIWNLTKEVH